MRGGGELGDTLSTPFQLMSLAIRPELNAEISSPHSFPRAKQPAKQPSSHLASQPASQSMPAPGKQIGLALPYGPSAW